MMVELQVQGCHNINFVTPEHVVPQIIEALPLAIEGGLRLPIVYNTSAYDSMESLELMDGVVDIYMPDFKYWDPEMARKYSKVADYPEVEVMRWIARELSPTTYVDVMAQYYPAGKVSRSEYAEINRRVTACEYEEALDEAWRAGLLRLDPRRPSYCGTL
jgi:putative pyruvate formate lyase activating enzyme